ncbi:Hemolysin, plasmid [Pseudovibrio sp. WM33]|nr:Hemolysin, plasmid [Pseudovibrio sp. WM33]
MNADDVSFASSWGKDLVITLSNGEQITVVDHFTENQIYSIEQIEFADGVVLNHEAIRNKSVTDQKSNGTGTVVGTDYAEIYTHTLGDGSYRISDLDHDKRTDRLVFTDVNADDASFAANSGDDLVITLSNGEQITIIDHFAGHLFNSIEQIEFADGVVLSHEAIRNKSVADQKANGTGTIIGSDYAEAYIHALGDGSYRISDLDHDKRADRLVFTDVNVGDVKFSSTTDEDLVITLSNGEQVTVKDHFANGSRFSIEQIEFADGTVLDLEAVRNKSVADQKISDSGTVIGSYNGETYTHALGDGSYQVHDYGSSDHTDRFVFTDVNSDQVVFVQSGDHLRIGVAGTDTITIFNQLKSSTYRIEFFEFADGVTWSSADVASRVVAAGDVPGDKVGTESDDTYTHAQGDGSYSIVEPQDYNGNETLTFTDTASTEVSYSRSGNDLILTLSNGEQITIVRQLDGDGYRSVESFVFADGITLNQDEVRNRLMADMKALGNVRGTEKDEAYTHTLGDGSYTIAEPQDYGSAETLTFTDVNSDDVSYSRSGNNLIIHLANGEQITIERQLDGDGYRSIESFMFANGITLTQDEVRTRLMADMKTSGAVLGTEKDEAYIHTMGDGSYAIAEPDAYRSRDTLSFADVNSDDVSYGRSGNNLIIHLPNGEEITVVRQLDSDGDRSVESFVFADGVTLTQDEVRGRLMADMKASGAVLGTEKDESYVHTQGDGTYSIAEPDDYNGAETLTFTDVNSDDVNYSRSGNNLIIRLPNGEEITVVRQLDSDGDRSIESFVFADGITLNQDKVRTRLMADMKASGAVLGTEKDEAYVHTQGDGSYTIAEPKDYKGNETLTFTDTASTEVRYSRSGNDLILTLSNGEQITVVRQLDSDGYRSIESFVFADDITLNQDEVRNRLMAEMKASGFVIGTYKNETYTHTMGDGSYSITDKDDYGSADTLTFTDVSAADVRFSRSGNNLIIRLPNGEQVTVIRQLDSNGNNAIETILFVDGTSMSRSVVSQLAIDSHTTDGNDVIIGTDAFGEVLNGGLGNDTLKGQDGDDVYHYSLGHGQDTIFEGGADGSNDKLILGNDIAQEDVIVIRSSEDLDDVKLVFKDGGSINLEEQFYNSREVGVEQIIFADGTIWDEEILLQKSVEATASHDRLVGGKSSDTIHADKGNDYIFGSDGNDTLYGDEGEDEVRGGNGDDTLYGGSGNDHLVGGDGVDTLDGGTDNDLLEGGKGNDIYLWGAGDGNDTIKEESGYGSDRLKLKELNADDIVLTQSLENPRDLIVTIKTTGESITLIQSYRENAAGRSEGVNYLEFADGTTWDQNTMRANTTLVGTASADIIVGDDYYGERIDGLAGDDLMTGNGGSDTFIFEGESFGHDAILDFEAGAGSEDVIRFDADLFADYDAVVAAMSSVGSDTVIKIDESNSVTLRNVTSTSLHQDDFELV